MNILVVNPPNKPFTNKSILAEPIDVLQVATVIKSKYDVKVLDMDVERITSIPEEYLDEENIIIFIFDYQLPLHTGEAVQHIFDIVKNTKATFIVIGKTSSYYSQKFIDNGIDVVIQGQAETKILEVIENIINKKPMSRIQTGETVDFNSLDYPDRSLLDISKYMETRTLLSSRGCIGKCSFCTTPTFFGKWVGKSPEKVVDEIEYLINSFNTQKIIFLDDNMTVDRKRMFNICDEIEKRNIHCRFGCLSSIPCYNKKMFERMYEVGFRWVHFGIESGSRRILKLMDKDMDIEKIKSIMHEVKHIGFRVRNSIILDYPGSTAKDIEATIDLIKETQPHELRLHYLAYRVFSPLFQNNDIKTTQYIHSNHPNVENPELTNAIETLIKTLKELNYSLVFDNTDWNKYSNINKDAKIASFIPMKYGLGWL